MSTPSVGRDFAAIVAVTSEFGIGNGGKLPWHPKRLQLDMAFLKFITTNAYCVNEKGGIEFFPDQRLKNAVVMGRKTWDSIPARFKPMENRINIIITSDIKSFQEIPGNRHPDVIAADSFDSALLEATRYSPNGQTFILGGTRVYEEALKHPNCKCIFITRLVDHPVMPCDAFFPGHLLEKYPKTVNITHKCHALLAPNLTIDNEGEHVTEGLIVYRIDVLSGEVKNWC